MRLHTTLTISGEGGRISYSKSKASQFGASWTMFESLSLQSSAHGQASRKDKYRFCVDFRNLNDATEPIYCPLSVKNNYMRKMTNSFCYHEYDLWVSSNSRRFPAFIAVLVVVSQRLCYADLGLKGARAYFQKIISALLFRGLMYTSQSWTVYWWYDNSC